MTERPPRTSRPESREVIELKQLKLAQPELATAVDMQIALVDMQRRVQARVPLPWIQTDPEWLRTQYAAGRPVVRFADIPLDWTDFRLTLRQTADILQRFEALERADYERIVAIGRDAHLLEPIVDAVVRRNLRRRRSRSARAPDRRCARRPRSGAGARVAPVSRPLRRGADAALDLPPWTHGHCPFCGWEPDFAVITPNADRRLICGRCVAQWAFGAAHLPVLHERRPLADHVVRDARRPVPRVRVRRLPPLSEGVRRAATRRARSWSRSTRSPRCRSTRRPCSAATSG